MIHDDNSFCRRGGHILCWNRLLQWAPGSGRRPEWWCVGCRPRRRGRKQSGRSLEALLRILGTEKEPIRGLDRKRKKNLLFMDWRGLAKDLKKKPVIIILHVLDSEIVEGNKQQKPRKPRRWEEEELDEIGEMSDGFRMTFLLFWCAHSASWAPPSERKGTSFLCTRVNGDQVSGWSCPGRPRMRGCVYDVTVGKRGRISQGEREDGSRRPPDGIQELDWGRFVSFSTKVEGIKGEDTKQQRRQGGNRPLDEGGKSPPSLSLTQEFGSQLAETTTGFDQMTWFKHNFSPLDCVSCSLSFEREKY